MTSPTVWYFAYGSNMNPRRLFDDRLARAGVARGRRIACRLDGWRLVFNKPWSLFDGAAAANIVADARGVVFGTLNEMPPEGLDVLDIHEGVADGHYERRPIEVLALPDATPTAAIVYVALNGLVDGLHPPRAYLDHLLAGADLLPPDYLAGLARTQCCALPLNPA